MDDTAMDLDLEDARAYLGCTRLTVDRSRHETTDNTVLWVFDGLNKHKQPRQVGCIKRLPGEPVSDYRWEVTRMSHGMPVARRSVKTLLEAVADIMRFETQEA